MTVCLICKQELIFQETAIRSDCGHAIRLEDEQETVTVPAPEEKPPQHPFEVRITIGGDTWEYVLEAIDEIASRVRKCGPNCGISSGGGGGSHSVDIWTRDISPDAYHDELLAWRERMLEHRGGERP